MAATFSGGIFEYIFLHANGSILNFTKICSQEFNWQYSFKWWLGTYMGRAIIWANDGLVYLRICASLGLDEVRRPISSVIQMSAKKWNPV